MRHSKKRARDGQAPPHAASTGAARGFRSPSDRNAALSHAATGQIRVKFEFADPRDPKRLRLSRWSRYPMKKLLIFSLMLTALVSPSEWNY